MSDITPGPPQPDESLPYYHPYIALVPGGDIVEILAEQIGATVAFLANVSPDQAVSRPAAGGWNAAEIVGHLADSERVFAYRALRIARGEPTPWTDADLERYVAMAGVERRSPAELAADYAAVRAATVALLRGLAAAAWARRAPADWTCRSARAIAYALAGHELAHLAELRTRFGVEGTPSA